MRDNVSVIWSGRSDSKSDLSTGIVHISVSMLNNNSNKVSFFSNLRQLTC